MGRVYFDSSPALFITAHPYRIRICSYVVFISPLRYINAQCTRHCVFFLLLDFAELFFSLLRIFFIITFCVPIQVSALLPPPNRRHERVPQVVLAMLVIFDVLPGEVGPATTRALLLNAMYKVHVGARSCRRCRRKKVVWKTTDQI